MPRRSKQRPYQPPRPRTRTFEGCLTCRARKVKCGQERPSCTNCTRLQLTCRGYKSQLQWLLVDPTEAGHQRQEPVDEAQHGPDSRQHKMRGNMFTVDERRTMAHQMLQIFSGQNLEEGLTKSIAHLDTLSATSGPATIGLFGVFSIIADTRIESEGFQNTINSQASPMLLDSHLLDWLASTFDEFNVAAGQDLLELPEVMVPSGRLDGELETQAVANPDSTSSSLFGSKPVEMTFEVQFLLDHFKSHLLHMLLPTPQTASTSPWTTIFLASASQALAGTSKTGYSDTTHRSLLYGIMAMSAFHADKVFNGLQINNVGSVKLSSSSWWKWGVTYAELTQKELCDYFGAQNGKVNSKISLEIAATLLCLLVMESIVGSTFDQQILLQICGILPRILDVSIPGTNHKLSVFKYILLYHQVIQASMSSPPFQNFGGSSSQPPFPSMLDRVLRHHVIEPNHPSGIEPSMLEFEDEEQRSFVKLYGFPILILQLISETTRLARELENFSSQHPDLATPSNLITQAHNLETRVLAEVSNIRCITSDTESARNSLYLAISKAAYNSLIIYFFRRVRKTNPVILQHYVDIVLACLVEQDHIKLHHELDAGFSLWPLVIAGCEAIGEDKQAMVTRFLKQIGTCGFHAADIAEVAIKELWQRRGTTNEDMDIRYVLQDLGLRLALP